MRGKPYLNEDTIRRTRNIPAYAGKTKSDNKNAEEQKEHPRVCGENLTHTQIQISLRGTSPRMRGKRALTAIKSIGDRNIPAYAGKTNYFGSVVAEMEEHPRVCGENFVGGF